jgi:dihydrolipoamide dehydrogenase
MEHRHADVVIIGGGPGGYVAGIRCGQHGLDTVVVDARPPGGTCLNAGCIPSKALIHAADEFARASETTGRSHLGITAADPVIDLAATVAWKDGVVDRLTSGVGALLARAGAAVVAGWATVIDGKSCEVTLNDPSAGRLLLTADHLVLAAGSVPVELPGLAPGSGGAGPPAVIDSTAALSLPMVPRALAVIGGGYIGVELGTAYAKLGAHVTIIEGTDRILPAHDRDLTRLVLRRLGELDVTVLTGATADGVTDGALKVSDISGASTLEVDTVLVTVGRRPMVDGWGLERLPLDTDGRFIVVDEQCRTSMRDVYAVGDLTGEPMLAHRAMKQGEVVADVIAGQPAAFDPLVIPAVVFSDPEIVTVGLSPSEAEAEHGPIEVGRFSLAANGRSLTLDRSTGFVRVVARAGDHLVVGAQAVGANVSELAGELSLALEMSARLEDLAGTIHAHPTVGEAVAEAAQVALGRPLHR